jgi:hypothetical protein
LGLFEEATALVTRAAFAARAVVLAPVGAAAALVGAKAASVERSTATATDGLAAAPVETMVVSVGQFAALKPFGMATVSAEAEAAAEHLLTGPKRKRLRGH